MTIFFTEFVSTLILCTIRPFFHALSMLFVVDPIAFILCTIRMRILTIAMCLIILPIAVIDVTVCVNEPTSSICFIVFPVSFVYTSVTPNLITSTMLLTSSSIPLTFVLSTVLQCFHRMTIFLDSWLIVFIVISSILEFRQSFSDLLDSCPLFFQFFRIHLNMNCTSE
jgi:hypothetical protein